MPNETFVWLTRIRDVERKYTSAQWATNYVVQAAQADPTILAWDLRPRDIRNASDRLQGTYIIRLFAQFETALRAFITAQAKHQPKWAEHLINRVGNHGKIPPGFAGEGPYRAEVQEQPGSCQSQGSRTADDARRNKPALYLPRSP
jgi:hypothetical protein